MASASLISTAKVAYHLINNTELAYTNPSGNCGCPALVSPPHHLHITTHHCTSEFQRLYKKQVKDEACACRLMDMVASPSECDFQAIVSLNMVKDCPITNNDICNAHAIMVPT
jgi:hypothetical protein